LKVKAPDDSSARLDLSLATNDWKVQSLEGEWTPETAGGCRFHKTFDYNPQFSFRVPYPTKITILMTQEEADEAAGFVVFRGQGTKGALEFESPYVRYQEGVHTLSLSPETYTLVPTLLDAGKEGAFAISLFSDQEIQLMVKNQASSWLDAFDKQAKEIGSSATLRNLNKIGTVRAPAPAITAALKDGAGRFNTIRQKPVKQPGTVKPPTDAPKDLEKMKAVREKVAKEILSTESTYVEGLDTAQNYYMVPMSNFHVKGLSGSELIKSIFGNLMEVLAVNRKLLMELEKKIKSCPEEEFSNLRIGHLFLDIADDLNSYIPYICNYNLSMETLERLEKSKDFRNFVKKCREESGQSLQLADYLIMPIQRIPRYVLLLKELLKNTIRGHPDYNDLQMALSRMKEVAASINENKRDAENQQRMVLLQGQLAGRLQEAVAAPGRKYIREGQFIVVDGGKQIKFYVFLTSDRLYVTKQDKKLYNVKHVITLPPSPPINECKEGFFIGGLLFLEKNQESKQVWLADLRGVGEAIKASRTPANIKNMTIRQPRKP